MFNDRFFLLILVGEFIKSKYLFEYCINEIYGTVLILSMSKRFKSHSTFYKQSRTICYVCPFV